MARGDRRFLTWINVILHRAHIVSIQNACPKMKGDVRSLPLRGAFARVSCTGPGPRAGRRMLRGSDLVSGSLTPSGRGPPPRSASWPIARRGDRKMEAAKNSSTPHVSRELDDESFMTAEDLRGYM